MPLTCLRPALVSFFKVPADDRPWGRQVRGEKTAGKRPKASLPTGYLPSFAQYSFEVSTPSGGTNLEVPAPKSSVAPSKAWRTGTPLSCWVTRGANGRSEQKTCVFHAVSYRGVDRMVCMVDPAVLRSLRKKSVIGIPPSSLGKEQRKEGLRRLRAARPPSRSSEGH